MSVMYEDIIKLLPSEPSPQIKSWVLSEDINGLGGDFISFSRESIDGKWGAYCECSACGGNFTAGWYSKRNNYPGGHNVTKGIRLYQGDDGLLLTGVVDQNESDDFDIVTIKEDTLFCCPICETGVNLIHRSSLRKGRTHQTLVTAIETVGEYTMLISYLIKRYMCNTNSFYLTAYPRTAVVINKNGRLLTFNTTKCGGWYAEAPTLEWHHSKKFTDPTQKQYHDYFAYNHRRVTGHIYRFVPNLIGSTGEKTGLDEYIRKGGDWPYEYLYHWSKTPNVENIVRSHWFPVLESGIDEKINSNLIYGITNQRVDLWWLDLNCKKPHEILHITKSDFRLSKNENWGWTHTVLEHYHQYCDYVEYLTAEEFDAFVSLTDYDQMISLMCFAMDGYEECEFSKVIPYLIKQYDKFDLEIDDGIQHFQDYREMLHQIQATGLTQEQYFPRNLVEAHDRYAEAVKVKTNKKTEKTFIKIAEQYNSLEFTDGDLCVRLPRSNDELVAEGKTLRHCVGTYGDRHIKGTDTIFFIRHYRRPERSYYTLDINMADGKPREVQLHGYGNEKHGKNKQYSHSITKKVRDFCDRWKEEILIPWWTEQAKAKLKGDV